MKHCSRDHKALRSQHKETCGALRGPDLFNIMTQLLVAKPILDTYTQTTRSPRTLAIILVGDDEESVKYVGIKSRKSETYGVHVDVYRLSEQSATRDVADLVSDCCANTAVNGVIVQLPLPTHIDTQSVLERIIPSKDVDNLTSVGNFVSPTVQSVLALIDEYGIQYEAKTICVVGQGPVVGRPLTDFFENKQCRVAIVDRDTPGGDDLIREADIVFGASGVHNRINDANTRAGQIIFDCSGKDVDFEVVKEKAAAITPPIGGIGPLTVHFLFLNVLKS